jgi:hypothetical protein
LVPSMSLLFIEISGFEEIRLSSFREKLKYYCRMVPFSPSPSRTHHLG